MLYNVLDKSSSGSTGKAQVLESIDGPSAGIPEVYFLSLGMIAILVVGCGLIHVYIIYSYTAQMFS